MIHMKYRKAQEATVQAGGEEEEKPRKGAREEEWTELGGSSGSRWNRADSVGECSCCCSLTWNRVHWQRQSWILCLSVSAVCAAEMVDLAPSGAVGQCFSVFTALCHHHRRHYYHQQQ